MTPSALILMWTAVTVAIIFGVFIIKTAVKQQEEFMMLMYGQKIKPKVTFLNLLEKCYELDNKKKKDRDRYIPCVAYTNEHTYGVALKHSIKEYKPFKRAWLAIIYAKIMAVMHDRFFLKEKDYGIIYYLEEK